MVNIAAHGRDIADMEPLAYALLMARVGVGLMYLGHALMLCGVLGLDHASHYLASIGLPAWLAYAMTLAELLGGTLLLAGIFVRPIALGLVPLLIAGAALHFFTGVGASLGLALYVLLNLAGQGLLAGWTPPGTRTTTVISRPACGSDVVIAWKAPPARTRGRSRARAAGA